MNINVLSEFDGISCGQLALQRAGVQVSNYYASEIDKYAIQIAKKNFPNTIHLGDVQNWKSWDLPKIDLLIAGSPCQGFSNAGRGLNFDDPRSKLFFEFVDTLHALQDKNPDLKFLLENVRMKQEWQDIISEQVGVKPIKINSSLVSAQNRVRLYWTNIDEIIQPEDRHIFLKDVIEYGDVDREKSYTIDANYFKGGNPRSYFEDGKRQLIFKHQSQKRAMIKVGLEDDIKGHDYNKRIYSPKGKSPTVNAHLGGNLESKVALDEIHYRKLSPLECERLQTLPNNYTEGISNTQRYKCIGNGWTVDVIAHIFSFLPSEFFE